MLNVKLDEGAVLPRYATAGSAGADIYCCIPQPLTIYVGQIIVVPTKVSLEIPDGLVGLVAPRSGLATRHGVTLINSVGVIDSDYRGELSIPLINLGSKPYTIEDKERIAQLILVPFVQPDFNVVDTLSDTIRGKGGFGSTGK